MKFFLFIFFWFLIGQITIIISTLMDNGELLLEDLWKGIKYSFIGPVGLVLGIIGMVVKVIDNNRYMVLVRLKKKNRKK